MIKNKINKNQISFEKIRLNLNKLPLISREGKLREFLSCFPNYGEAWHMLIALVASNGNHIEAIRLSKLALGRFKDDRNFLNNHIDLLLNQGMWDEAKFYLDLFLNHPNKTIDKTTDDIEFGFMKDPVKGLKDIQKKYLENNGNLRLTASLLSAQSITKFGTPSICFYLSSEWHWPIQEPITQELNNLKMSFYVTTKIWAIKLLDPKIIVISDAAPGVIRWIRTNLPQAKIVSTRHGIGVGGKNYGLYAAAATDYICVTSESIKNDLCNRALLSPEQVWVTGFTQMDGLFKLMNLGVEHSNFKSVTYAPTFDPKLSSIEVIGDNPVHWIRGNNKNIKLTIRPHPHLFRYNPTLMSAWKKNISQEANVFFDDSQVTDLSSLLIKTDLLISDVSSVALQFIALNRPIVCVVDLEKAKTSPKYAPNELEWKMHDSAKVVTKKIDLSHVVETLLVKGDDTDTLAKRNQMRKYLFGDVTDGRAGIRIAKNLSELHQKLF